MKNLIIFEGIASSGKTTLERMLNEHIEGSEILSEDETLMPLIENKDVDIALSHLGKMIDVVGEMDASTVIVDRFHFTHCFRTGSDLSVFRNLEEIVQESFETTVIFLRLDEKAILSRIEETMQRRGEGWAKGKQGSLEEKVEYYAKQQQRLAEMMESSLLPVVTIDTTDKDWSRCLLELQNVLDV